MTYCPVSSIAFASDLDVSIELIAIINLFHQSHSRTFKASFTEYVQHHLYSEFPTLVSYLRFVKLVPTVLIPLVAYLHTKLGHCTGISFIDSTSLTFCRNPPIHQHQVCDGRAARGKTPLGWFYGLKLHLVVNDQGELLALACPGQCRRPASCFQAGERTGWQVLWEENSSKEC
jgi:hypothetical protein